MRYFAPAKLNLCLDLGALRPDGYHEVRTVMQAVSLGDRLLVTPAASLQVENPSVPDGDLVLKAAELFARAAARPVNLRIAVRKRIPIGAGLGGGSSDAACALRALWGLLRQDMPKGEVLQLAGEIGSDVPFFLGPAPLALAEGRGERLTPLSPRPPLFAVIAWPQEGLSTAAVYRESLEGPGGAAQEVLSGARLARNDLERAARRLSPGLEAIMGEAERCGVHLQVTGSGSAAFALFEDRADARAAHRAIPPLAAGAVLCSTLPGWPWQGNEQVAGE